MTTIAQLENIRPSAFGAYANRGVKLIGIIFHTDQGRELFGEYTTKAEARIDAKKYNITLTN